MAHLIINDRGGFRATKGRPTLDANEIAIQLNLDVPDIYFQRPYPVVDVSFDPRVAQLIDHPEFTDVAVRMTAETVAEALKVDVAQVRDGLQEAVAAAAEVAERDQAQKGR